MVVVVAITITISIKCKYIYNTHWQASDLPRLFLSARGGSLSVGGVVLRSDALASALISIIISKLQCHYYNHDHIKCEWV